MKLLRTYFSLELKKGFLILGKSACSMICVLAALILSLFFISRVFLNAGVFELLTVGIVHDENDESIELVTNYVASMESVSSVCRFDYMSENEAKERLEEGSIQAYIVFPEDVYHDIDSGKNTPAMVYFPRQSSVGTKTFQELLVDVVAILQKSEAGIYSAADEGRKRVSLISRSQMRDALFQEYVRLAFLRGDLFNQTVKSSTKDMEYSEYFYSAGVAIALLFFGLNFGGFYRKQEQTVSEVLRVQGLTSWKKIFVKVGVMTLLLWIIAAFVYLASCLASRISVDLRMADTLFIRFRAENLFFLLFLSFSVASFFHMIYRIGKDGAMGTVILLLSTLWMLMVSGVLIPMVYLPKWAGTVGRFMPLTFWDQFCAEMFFGQREIIYVLGVLSVGIVEIAVGELLSWRNT